MYNLIIVDDEYEINNGMSKYFPWQDIGFCVDACFQNGKDAYEYIQQNSVDVVLCDINMPVMNGLDLARLIFNHFPQIQVVFLSGYSDFKYAQEALELNVKSYILKSAPYNEIIRVFTKLKALMDTLQDEAPDIELGEDKSFSDNILLTIKAYIDENYATVTLEELTNLVHMNPDYISKFFKQKTGQNFSDYLLDVRMKKASALLDDIHYKTYEISALMGYSNSVNFTRAFKRFYGISPREYRNRKSINTKNEREDAP